ncbi:MAG: ester cyclase [Halodesulfovibrio sp.]
MISLKQTILAGAAMLLALAGTANAQPVHDIKAEEANRVLVLKFYDTFFNKHQVDEAAKVVADNYIQHNPSVPDGKEPFVSYFRGFFKENPESKVRIVRSAVDGDIVWLHIHSVNNAKDTGEAVVDIFRVQDGMIVEHWDVIQPVPQTAENTNTMF